MTAIDIELLLATAAAIWIGTRLPSRSRLLLSIIGLSVATWTIRFALIVNGSGADISLAEAYLDGLTVWNAAAEIGIFVLWSLLWAFLGLVAVKSLQRKARTD